MTNKIFKYIIKNKYNILYFLFFSLLLFVFVPSQEKYYFKSDIQKFESEFYLDLALVISTKLSLIVLIVDLLKKNKPKEILNCVFGIIVFRCWFFFFFQSIIISLTLFVNRKFNIEKIEKEYKVIYVTENKLLSAYNIKNENDIINEDEYLKHPQHQNLSKIKTNEIIKLDFYKGILGVNSIKK